MIIIEKAFQLPTRVMQAADTAALSTMLPLGPQDLVVTEKRHLQSLNLSGGPRVLLRDDLGSGPNTAALLQAAVQAAGASYSRVIGIGSGTVLDLAKLLSLEQVLPAEELFDHQHELRRARELILIPTTPGTGTEVTPYCALYVEKLGMQLILNSQALYADAALLCPQFLQTLPFSLFAASSFDAFTHAFESYLSALATPFSRALSLEALKNIVLCWQDLTDNGISRLSDHLAVVQTAGTMAGIAYANAGAAAIHALAYPLSMRLGLNHGQANYLVFHEVCSLYQHKQPAGALEDIQLLLAALFKTTPDQAFAAFDRLCTGLIPRSRLSALGMQEKQILEFTDMVMTRQHMLIANGYVRLTAGEIAGIYRALL